MPISKINNIPIGVGHSHSNKGVLDSTTASFTAELLLRVDSTRNIFEAPGWTTTEKYKVMAHEESTVNHGAIIQAFIESLEALGSIVEIIFPPGLYSCYSGIRVRKAGIHLKGGGGVPAFHNSQGLTPPNVSTLRAMPGFSDKTLVKLVPELTYTIGTTPFDGGVPTSWGLDNIRFGGFTIDCNLNAREGLRTTDIETGEIYDFHIQSPTEKGLVLGSYLGMSISTWESDRRYSHWDSENDKIAHRVRYGNSVYYCKVTHDSTGGNAPTVEGISTTEWGYEGTWDAVLAAGKGEIKLNNGFGGNHYSVFRNFSVTCRDFGVKAHCVVVYQSLWYSDMHTFSILHHEGDGFQFWNGDHVKLRNGWTAGTVAISSYRARHGQEIQEGEVVSWADDETFAWDEQVFTHSPYNQVTFASRNIYDQTHLRKFFKCNNTHTLDSATEVDADNNSNFDFIGYETDTCRGMYFSPYANNYHVEGIAAGLDTIFFEDRFRVDRKERMVDLYETGMDCGIDFLGRPFNGTHQFTELDCQYETRFVADPASRVRIDNANTIQNGKHVGPVFTNKRELGHASDYIRGGATGDGQVEKANGTHPNRPALTGAASTFISDNGKHIRLYALSPFNYFYYAFQDEGFLGDLSADWNVELDPVNYNLRFQKLLGPGCISADENSIGGNMQSIDTSISDATMDWGKWNHGYLLLDKDINGITFIDSTNTSQAGTIQIFQDAVGGRSLSGWDPAIQWVNASAPIMPSFPEEGIICSFIYNGIRGVYIGSWSLLQ